MKQGIYITNQQEIRIEPTILQYSIYTQAIVEEYFVVIHEIVTFTVTLLFTMKIIQGSQNQFLTYIFVTLNIQHNLTAILN